MRKIGGRSARISSLAVPSFLGMFSFSRCRMRKAWHQSQRIAIAITRQIIADIDDCMVVDFFMDDILFMINE